MNTLENMVSLAERLAGKVEAIADAREDMLLEIKRLRKRLIERDKEAVKAVQEMRAELETARMDALRFERELTGTNAGFQGLSDRLVSLVSPAGLTDALRPDDEKHFGG